MIYIVLFVISKVPTIFLDTGSQSTDTDWITNNGASPNIFANRTKYADLDKNDNIFLNSKRNLGTI